jgi:hypothetical protein
MATYLVQEHDLQAYGTQQECEEELCHGLAGYLRSKDITPMVTDAIRHENISNVKLLLRLNAPHEQASSQK